jgi:hypothetical protein
VFLIQKNNTKTTLSIYTNHSGWSSHVKGTMEDEMKKKEFKSLAIFSPAAIYPGNDNTPSTFGWLNQQLNWVIPGAYNTVSAANIGLGMDLLMRKQVKGEVAGTVNVSGGEAIGRLAGEGAVPPQRENK